MTFRDEVEACPSCGRAVVLVKGLDVEKPKGRLWRCGACGAEFVAVRALADLLTENAPSLLGPDRMREVITRSRPAESRDRPKLAAPLPALS